MAPRDRKIPEAIPEHALDLQDEFHGIEFT
jgi:hypothetical protein